MAETALLIAEVGGRGIDVIEGTEVIGVKVAEDDLAEEELAETIPARRRVTDVSVNCILVVSKLCWLSVEMVKEKKMGRARSRGWIKSNKIRPPLTTHAAEIRTIFLPAEDKKTAVVIDRSLVDLRSGGCDSSCAAKGFGGSGTTGNGN